MSKAAYKRLCLFFFACTANFGLDLFIFKDSINIDPWTKSLPVNLPTWADANDERIALIENSEKSVTVLNGNHEFVYTLQASRSGEKSFSSAKFVTIDERNNVYLLDTDFNGYMRENIERVLQFSPEGKFVRELYSHRYINDDFIITKGKIAGMNFYDGYIYIVRMESDGFWLTKLNTRGTKTYDEGFFIQYPHAFRDLTFFYIDPEIKTLTVTTKAGGIKQFGFEGSLIYEMRPEGLSLPWTAVSGGRDYIYFTDIINGVITRLNTANGGRSDYFRPEEGAETYRRVNYAGGRLIAASDANILLLGENSTEYIDSEDFSERTVRVRAVCFAFLVLGVICLIASIIVSVLLLRYVQFSPIFRRIALSTLGIALGAVVASIIIINEMWNIYYDRIYNDLENVSRLITMNLDTDTLLSLDKPGQYEEERFLSLKEDIKTSFSRLPFEGQGIYQFILREKDGLLHVITDIENSAGVFYPWGEYEGSSFQKAAESKKYIYTNETTNEGTWVYVNGPIFDKHGNAVALVETGFTMSLIQEEMRAIALQTVLIVIASAIAFLLLLIEFILILDAYGKYSDEFSKKSELPFKKSAFRAVLDFLSVTERDEKRKEKAGLPAMDGGVLNYIISAITGIYNKNYADGNSSGFKPELLRAVTFFLFITVNLSTAVIPMYAASLYRSVSDLPREFIITLPLTADMAFSATALLVVPLILERFSLKAVAIIASLFLFSGFTMCFVVNDIILLSIAYAFIGFSGGAIVLVINAIIGVQKDERDINNGFAHYNASYLAGLNVGVVFGSILGQFFQYRTLFAFSMCTSGILIAIIIFSTRSKAIRHLYNVRHAAVTDNINDWQDSSVSAFLGRPRVTATLFLLLLPYSISTNFTTYFMPIYAIEHGLRESNIGQLILISGLLAILFGTSFCEAALQMMPLRLIIFASILLHAAGIYLFATNVSVFMLIITIIIISIANIFVLTNVQTYYAKLYQNTSVSPTKALGLYSAVENFSLAVGPIVFSYIISNSVSRGMKAFALIIAGCLGLFMLISSGKERPRVAPTSF